jgi:hypothetical protein
MLVDFFKGNHLLKDLATAPWLWETKGYLDGSMMNVQGKGLSGYGAQNIFTQGLSRVIQDMRRLAQLKEAQVRFPGGRRSFGSAPIRFRAGFSGWAQKVDGVSGPRIDNARDARALAAPRQSVQQQISCRQGQCQQRRPQWALIKVQQPLGEATRLWGRKRLAVSYLFL